MRGYPAHFATMHDVNVAMEMNEERTKARLQELIDGSRGWHVTESLAKDLMESPMKHIALSIKVRTETTTGTRKNMGVLPGERAGTHRSHN